MVLNVDDYNDDNDDDANDTVVRSLLSDDREVLFHGLCVFNCIFSTFDTALNITDVFTLNSPLKGSPCGLSPLTPIE